MNRTHDRYLALKIGGVFLYAAATVLVYRGPSLRNNSIEAHKNAESPGILLSPEAKDPETLRLEALFDRISKIGPTTTVGTFTEKESIVVSQHEWARTNAKSPKPVLGTKAAATCLAIAIYNPSTKTAMLAHIDAGTPDSELKRMFQQIRKKQTQSLEVHLAGGHTTSKKNVMRWLDIIDKEPNVKIVSTDIAPEGEKEYGRRLAIDARNGRTFMQFSTNQLGIGKNFWIGPAEVMGRLIKGDFKNFPLLTTYDAEQSAPSRHFRPQRRQHGLRR